MKTPRFEVVDEIFVITAGAACPSFACEDEFNAKVAMHSLNELLDRAEAAEAVEAELREALNTALDRAKAAESREAKLRVDRAKLMEWLLETQSVAADLVGQPYRKADAEKEINAALAAAETEAVR